MPHKQSSRRVNYTKLKKHPLHLPDLMLCDDCVGLGYCKEYASDHLPEPSKIATRIEVTRPFNLNYYTAKIPLRVDSKLGLSRYAKEHLQTAYGAFHQDDFETALLHFKSVEPGGAYYYHSDYFLALTYFMLGNYQMADAHMQACIDHIFFRDEDLTTFLDECCQRSVIALLDEELTNNTSESICTSNAYL